ncbi:NICE-3 protein [Ditylenchus destructor]|nr:NICE-3 protein [Ditylenchus destructor]
MRGMMTLSLGGYTIIFAVTFLMLVAVLFGIFVYRQIQRLRNNSARKEINSSVALELSKKGRAAIKKKIEAVHCFRKIHFPKFTDCTMISEHANSPMVHRMIAFDEIIRDVDRQLEFIKPELARIPGESTYIYLKRIKLIELPELSEEFIARLAFLHEWCRFRPEMQFGEVELEETRALLKSFLKILNNQQRTSLPFNPAASTKTRSLEQTRSASNAKVIFTPKAASLPGGSRSTEKVPLLYASNPDGTASPNSTHSGSTRNRTSHNRRH